MALDKIKLALEISQQLALIGKASAPMTDNTEISVTATWGMCDKCGVTYALNTIHVCELNYVVVYNARLVLTKLTKIEDLLTQILERLEGNHAKDGEQ